MIIENKDKKTLIEMTDEEIVAIVRGKAAGKVEIFYGNIKSMADSYTVDLNAIYRLVPTYTPITVDWSVLDDSIQWIAADASGAIFGHISEPVKLADVWGGQGCLRLQGIKSLNRGDIPWDQSLIKRPEDV